MASHSHDLGVPFILRLPPSVRRRIYLFLGFARWDGFPILFDLDGPFSPDRQIGFYGLLLSCRAIYTEASNLLYSSNRFVIHYETKRSLQSLRQLTASSLASLTSLKLVLNQTSCHHRRKGEWSGKCCGGSENAQSFCQSLHTSVHDVPLEASDSSALAVLDEWHQAAAYLSSRIRPRHLQLSLVCDFHQENVQWAKEAVATLRLLPELKDCNIRLCRRPNTELHQIAQDAALQACRRPPLECPSPPPASSSRLLGLPREIRLRILEYTDLVTPRKEVMWDRLDRGFQYPDTMCAAGDRTGIPCPLARHHGCQFFLCHDQLYMKGDVAVYENSLGCFCRLRHAAFSSTCRCWAPPTPLFLTCRTLCEDARFVFFSLNRFVVSDSLASHNPWHAFDVWDQIKRPENGNYWESQEWRDAQPPSAYPADRFAASQFLREVVPADCLGYLRFLEIVFPPYNHACWPKDGHPALLDWAETIRWIKGKINAPALTIRLVMAGSLSWSPEHPDQRVELTEGQGGEVLAGYERIVKPLALLTGQDGIARFYADFAWPWKWTTWADEKRWATEYEAWWKWMKSKEDELNESAERFVMGNRYGQLHSGASAPEDSPWKVAYASFY